MNESRVTHIEEALAELDHKVDGLGRQLEGATVRLDGRIDALGAELRAEMKAGFENAFRVTQGGFDDHRAFSQFLVNGLRDETSRRFNGLRDEMNRRFNHVDRRFDGLENRFDRLEILIKGQTPPSHT